MFSFKIDFPSVREDRTPDVKKSSVISYRLLCSSKTPSPASSTGSPPVTTLIRIRPLLSLSKVAAIRAASVGEIKPGRTATKKRIWLVSPIRDDAVTQASSQDRPVGNSAP